MNNSGDAAGTVQADRMISAMQMSGNALLMHHPDDACAFLRDYHTDPELRLSIGAYVAHLKGLGLAPEQCLIAIKRSIDQFERLPRRFDSKRLIECVISLCIEEYYRA